MKMHKQVSLMVALGALSIILTSPLSAFSSAPLKYPDSLKIPVTYYDFHSDSSNPEFEITPSGTPIKTTMIRDTLDKDKKPILGSTPYFNRNIDRWFRPWVSGNRRIYNYANEYANRYRRYTGYDTGWITLPYDTSFKNIVIKDTLVFKLINNTTGTYEFSDTSFFPLDDTGFGKEGRAHNFAFAMELHSEFSKVPGLQFQFSGDDDVWAFVNNQLRMDLGGIHAAQTGSFSLDQISGLVDNYKYAFDFFYVERHVTQSSIKITTNILHPIVKFKLAIFPNDTICPLTPVTLQAIVTDDISGPRPDLSKNTRWRVINYNGQSPTSVQLTVGDSIKFTPDVAYSLVEIEGTIFDGKDSLKDTVFIAVHPCEPYKIYIEAGPVNMKDTNALRKPQELDKISILADSTKGFGYAIARDISGAYVRLADDVTTQWTITPDGAAIATAAGVDGQKYKGIVTRIGTVGETFAVATEPGLLPDSVKVFIAPWYVVRYQLRDAGGNIVHAISMMSDDVAEYFAWGLKSTHINDTLNPNAWVLTNAKWALTSDSITVKNPPKADDQSWVIEPTYPGTGTVRLTNPSEQRTLPLNIPIIVKVSPPSKVFIKLVTPSPRYAGKPLQLEVQIHNGDGPVPGKFCFGAGGDNPNNAIYSDKLGVGGGNRPYPRIIVDGVDTLLNVNNQTVFSAGECFMNGVDTVSATLFYAPFNPPPDSLHQITISFGVNSSLTAKTDPFALLAGMLEAIVIEDVNYTPIPPQVLKDKESITPYADGYDRFGNRIGFIISKWSSTGTLNQITDSATYTYVTADSVRTDQQGTVCATQFNEEKKPISACLSVTIIGPRKVVLAAITRDLNGNGLLDAIEFVIDRKVTQDEIALSNFVDIRNGTTLFPPNNITFIDTNIFRIHFAEKDPSKPQTAWKLYYSIANSLTIATTTQGTTIDGAGPVIWRAVRNIPDKTVKIYLSEKVKNVNNNLMNTNDNPSLTFNVYSKDQNGIYTPLPLIDKITTFSSVTDSIFTFLLTDSTDISVFHYFNIETMPSVVQDNVKNLPHPDNIKRQVEVEGQNNTMVIGPNPTKANFTHTNAGVLALLNDRLAIEVAKYGKGTVIQVKITPDSLMSATLKIHDQVGNLVNWAYVPDYLTYLRKTGSLAEQEAASVLTLNIYWNGSNHQGMPVSPGVYRVVFMIDYKSSPLADIKFVDVVGIKR